MKFRQDVGQAKTRDKVETTLKPRSMTIDLSWRDGCLHYTNDLSCYKSICIELLVFLMFFRFSGFYLCFSAKKSLSARTIISWFDENLGYREEDHMRLW